MEERGKPLLVIAIAFVLLCVMSIFGWEELSGGFLKSFDMFGDVRPGGPNVPLQGLGQDYLDPDLAMLTDDTEYEYIDENLTSRNGFDEHDTPMSDDPARNSIDNRESHGPAAGTPTSQSAQVPERRNVSVTIKGRGLEDYSGGPNIQKLRQSLAETSRRLVRMAAIGDSYIEGDIFTEGIRTALQDKYGGKGIGYSPLYSEIPGFRRTVLHSCSDFELLDFRKGANSYCLLQGVASKAESGAAATFSGTKKTPHLDSWDRTRIILTAPTGGSVTLKTADASPRSFSFGASNDLQFIDLPGTTSKVSISGITPGVIFQGIYLDGNTGIALDNMSIRGYSGIRHDEINSNLTAQARGQIDYDIILLEFGINALSASQTNYNAYGNKMTKVVKHIKTLYPNAVIIICGIGDRGEKRGNAVHSMSTIPDMIAVQRKVARDTGSLFWDIQNAMGGEDAIVEWVENKDVNKDYIHLSNKGGKKLASLFIDALNYSLNE